MSGTDDAVAALLWRVEGAGGTESVEDGAVEVVDGSSVGGVDPLLVSLAKADAFFRARLFLFLKA